MPNKLHIQKPIWGGGTRCIGIAEFRLPSDYVDVYIAYRRKRGDLKGQLEYPEIYRIESAKAKTFPTQKVRGVKLFIIPLTEFEIIGTRSDEEGEKSQV